jgi:flagellar protein FlaG
MKTGERAIIAERTPGEARATHVCQDSSVMTPQVPPKLQLVNTPDYRESYANSVQIRVNLWDFFLMFGTVNQAAPDSVMIQNFQGIYISPQQAKALLNVLTQNLSQYEATFGEIKLEPHTQVSAIQ